MANGRARVVGKNKLGAVAKYSCMRGYELQGVETRVSNSIDLSHFGYKRVCMVMQE